MDLAKIRKKSLQSLEKVDAPRLATPAPLSDLTKQPPDAVAASFISAEADFLNNGPDPVPVVSIGEVPLQVSSILSPPRAAACTPLEAILAGRTAAGCDDESVLADEVTTEVVAESCLEFLCFRVSDEIYGINIMDIKEIIKPREVTEVPRAPHFVSGILSLRGTIIPIIDMRVRLGLDRAEPTGKERIIVIKNNNSLSGLLVDEVIQVVQVPQDAVEAAPTVLDGIDRDFVSGLGRSEGRLIIILHLENIADIDLY